MRFFTGCDLGQANDFTAISVIERVDEKMPDIEYIKGFRPPQPDPAKSIYHLRHLERPKLGTLYPDIVTRVGEVLSSLPANERTLIIDSTGVGRAVFDMFTKAGLPAIGVNIHGGNSVTRSGGFYNCPKRDLVGSLQVLFQSGWLLVADRLPLAQTLIDELVNFKVKIDLKTAHDSYSAWRERDHDGLVLSVALACWFAVRHRPQSRALGKKPSGF